MAEQKYIPLDAAIAAIEAIPEGNWKTTRYTKAIKAIPAADVVERPQWIPVTERLPEVLKRVLVYSKIQGVISDFICHDGSGWYRAALVTHWMPLPEPPKEEV